MGNLRNSKYKKSTKARMRTARRVRTINAPHENLPVQETYEGSGEEGETSPNHAQEYSEDIEQEHVQEGQVPHENDPEVMEIDRQNDKGFDLEGRRIVNIKYLFSQILNGEVHEPFNCSIVNMQIVSERHIGLQSIFSLKCSFCGLNKEISTEHESLININSSAVAASVSTGCGYTALEEVLCTMNIPPISKRRYTMEENSVSSIILKSAWSEMEKAGQEEARLATENGEVDDNGTPLITVIADGAWCKRSYGKNYDAKSGVACIVGARTGKLLFLGVRNKYCTICARLQKGATKDHRCSKNWISTSTSMESDIILEGFHRSKEILGVIFNRLIGDGDSSIMNKLNITKPYGQQMVTKIECTNHLLRNYCNKLRELAKKRYSSSNKFVPVFLRKRVNSSILRLRYAVTKAVQHRKSEAGVVYNVRIQNLNSDLLNSPRHVFGDHSNCAEYFCNGKEEQNYVPQMEDCGVFQDIVSCIDRLVRNSCSLLSDMTNNPAELYNSILCKFVGGKRINFSQKGSYEMRCYAAALSYNSKGDYHKKLHEAMAKRKKQKKLGRVKENYITKLKRKRAWTQLHKRRARGRKFEAADKDYGAVDVEETPEFQVDPSLMDMPDDQFEQKKLAFLENLKKCADDIKRIEESTRGQSTCQLWRKERSMRLTASSFGKICKLKRTTSCANTVKELLYTQFCGSAATKYGLDSEPKARRAYIASTSETVIECGFLIGSQGLFYLGASPDGLVGENGLLEIKCPHKAKDMTVEDAIREKIIKFATVDENNEIKLKENDLYMYQVQGQMHIANKDFCIFMIWTSKNFKTQKILRDIQFWNKMEGKLKTFYFKCFLPEILDPRFTRDAPYNIIRNPERN